MEYREVSARVLRTTDGAVLIRCDDDSEHWIPWSCVEDNAEEIWLGDLQTIYVAEWKAEAEGIE